MCDGRWNLTGLEREFHVEQPAAVGGEHGGLDRSRLQGAQAVEQAFAGIRGQNVSGMVRVEHVDPFQRSGGVLGVGQFQFVNHVVAAVGTGKRDGRRSHARHDDGGENIVGR